MVFLTVSKPDRYLAGDHAVSGAAHSGSSHVDLWTFLDIVYTPYRTVSFSALKYQVQEPRPVCGPLCLCSPPHKHMTSHSSSVSRLLLAQLFAVALNVSTQD